jgi:Fe-S-cluster containining protein
MDTCQKCGGWCCMHYRDDYNEILPFMCASFNPKTIRCEAYDVRPANCLTYPTKVDGDDPCPLYKERYGDSS